MAISKVAWKYYHKKYDISFGSNYICKRFDALKMNQLTVLSSISSTYGRNRGSSRDKKLVTKTNMIYRIGLVKHEIFKIKSENEKSDLISILKCAKPNNALCLVTILTFISILYIPVLRIKWIFKTFESRRILRRIYHDDLLNKIIQDSFKKNDGSTINDFIMHIRFPITLQASI